MFRQGGASAGVSPVTSTRESAAGPAAVTASDPLVLAPGSALIAHVEQARAGDRYAFEVLVEQRLHQTFRTACAILGNEADGQDATQESFVQAWRNLPRLRDPASFDAWFGRIIVNACRQVLRSRRRRSLREIPTTDLFDPLEGVETSDPALDERAASSDALERAFEQLSIHHRAILVRHHLEHQAVAEIASDLGIPAGTAKSRLHAARQALERALKVELR
jgi:RNA polymerase sigma-70 factor (ECF subfamily)